LDSKVDASKLDAREQLRKNPMTPLRYIRLPNPTRREWTADIGTDLNRAIAAKEARGFSYDTTVYSARNRFRPLPQAASVMATAADMDSHELHAYRRDSQPMGLSWGKIHRSVRAALQRMQQRLRGSGDC
jgi:hypothetical protein